MEYLDSIKKILLYSVPVGIVTIGPDGSHLIGVWSSEITMINDEILMIPVAGMNRTEENIRRGSDIKLLIASHDVPGSSGMGTGYRVIGTAEFHYSGSYYEQVKAQFDWARAALVVSIDAIDKLI